MQRRDRAPQDRAEDPLERDRERLDDRDVQAEVPERRRDLGADEAHADQDRPAPARRRGPDPVGVPVDAQVEHALQVHPGDRRPPGPAAGGDDHGVERDALAALELDRALRGERRFAPSPGPRPARLLGQVRGGSVSPRYP
jgi:hypothetical protein